MAAQLCEYTKTVELYVHFKWVNFMGHESCFHKDAFLKMYETTYVFACFPIGKQELDLGR